MVRIDVKGVIVSDENKKAYDWLGMANTAPCDVSEKITKANGEDLDVYINSSGGDLMAGTEIYSALQAYTGNVFIHIVGMACSSASVIACAGESDIAVSGMFMYHNVSSGAYGDHRALEKQAEILEVADRAVALAYEAKTGKSINQLLEEMGNETWLSADKAVKAGFVDRIAESQNANAPKLAAVSMVGTMLSNEAVEKVKAIIQPPNADNMRMIRAQAKMKLLNLGGKE